ncbi:MAG: chromate efflux transporter [Rhodospirillaceae bacterium]|nr:chromate efflux transporter [Rhodospirillaceae bacterium]
MVDHPRRPVRAGRLAVHPGSRRPPGSPAGATIAVPGPSGTVRPPWPSFSEALVVWTRVALLSFGGPAGQIAVMHRILVEEKRWLGEARFLHALNFCMLLPGPEAQQLAVYVGWLMHRTAGGIVAGLLFVLPGAVAIMALSWIYAIYGQVALVTAVFFGLKAAVLAIVLQAVVRIGRRALKSAPMVAVAATSFAAIFAFDVPFPLIILAAALTGLVAERVGARAFRIVGTHGGPDAADACDGDTVLGDALPPHARPGGARTLAIGGALLVLWLAPTAVLLLVLGPDHVFSAIAGFFSRMAVVTFGGAYAVLAYVAQAAVDTFGWLAPGEMLDGLGMAETTPGPLIMVTQFVGFMGAFRDPGALAPLVAGTLGGLLTTWVTFAPCFLWIFVCAPHVERLRGNLALSAGLAAITAAVVGVVLNLAVWFALHTLFREVGSFQGAGLQVAVPRLATLDPAAAGLAGAALAAAFVFKVNTVALLAGAAACGAALHALGVVS